MMPRTAPTPRDQIVWTADVGGRQRSRGLCRAPPPPSPTAAAAAPPPTPSTMSTSRRRGARVPSRSRGCWRHGLPCRSPCRRRPSWRASPPSLPSSSPSQTTSMRMTHPIKGEKEAPYSSGKRRTRRRRPLTSLYRSATATLPPVMSAASP